MKKGLIILLSIALVLSFATNVALADDPLEGVISITMQGNNFDFEVQTQTAKAWDVFSGESDGFMEMHQDVCYLPDTYYPPGSSYHHTTGINVDCDTDRWAHFAEGGRIDVATRYHTSGIKPGTYEADSLLYGYVESSDSEGYLSQQLRFERERGGVYETGLYCIPQRDIHIDGYGDYILGFGAVDLRGGIDENNKPIDPDWSFDFCAADSSGSGLLSVDEAFTHTDYLLGQGYRHRPDSFTVDFGFGWEGDAGSQTLWSGEFTYYADPDGNNLFGYNEPSNIDMTIDIENYYVGGDGEIW